MSTGLIGDTKVHATARSTAGRLCFELCAFLAYLAASFLFFGLPLQGHFSTRYIGTTTDPSVSMWMLAWWPHALSRGVNPFFPHALWAPFGTNLAWATSIPFAAVLSSPITRAWGPVASYNILCILLPALAAYSAFILARYVTGSLLPALLAGYLFGFSPYMLSAVRAHLCLLLVFPVPLGVYLVLRRLAGDIGRLNFIGLFTIVLAMQFWCFIEVFATATFFGTISLGLAAAFFPGLRRRLAATVLSDILLSYGGALLLALPYLYAMVAMPVGGVGGVNFNTSIDALNFVVPSDTLDIGRLATLCRVSSTFGAGFASCGFLIPQLIVTALAYRRSYAGEGSARFLASLLLVMCVLAVGPFLHVAGRAVAPMPWLVFAKLPLLGYAIPARFMLYADLVGAVVLSLWLCAPSVGSAMKPLVVALTLAMALPSLSGELWTTKVDAPPLFSGPEIRNWLRKGETIVIIPYGVRGNSMLWQAMSGFHFRMAEGWTGAVPPEFNRWPAVTSLLDEVDLPDEGTQFKAFLAQHRVTAVAVTESEQRRWHSLLETLRIKPVLTGGVYLYRLSSGELGGYQRLDPWELQRKADQQRLSTLLRAANQYLEAGNDPAKLTPISVRNLGLLETGPLGDGLSGQKQSGFWLRDSRGSISAGVEVIGAENAPLLISAVGSCASAVCFPCFNYENQLPAFLAHAVENFPSLRRLVFNIAASMKRGIGKEMLTFTFDRDGLKCAAARMDGRASSGSAPR